MKILHRKTYPEERQPLKERISMQAKTQSLTRLTSVLEVLLLFGLYDIFQIHLRFNVMKRSTDSQR